MNDAEVKALSLSRLRKMLRETERIAGHDSQGAVILRRLIVAKQREHADAAGREAAR